MKRLALVALAGCADSTPSSLLDGPRVLAIVAEPPALPTTLTAITAVDGLPAAPDAIRWRVCPPGAVVADPIRDCTDGAIELPVDGDGRALVDPASFGITVPQVPACTYALTVVTEIEFGTTRLVAKKQLSLVPSRNPAFVRILADGEPIVPVPASSTILLGADIALDSRDPSCEDPARAETVRVVVYPGGGATASNDSFEITDEDGATRAGAVELELPDAPGDIPLWLVAVDETGGSAATFVPLSIR